MLGIIKPLTTCHVYLIALTYVYSLLLLFLIPLYIVIRSICPPQHVGVYRFFQAWNFFGLNRR